MLLSMYVSYQLANHNKITYVLSMVVFVVLISFLSAILPLGMIGDFLVLPLLCLSFPFYAYVTPIFSWEQHTWVDFYKVRFLIVDLTSAQPLSSGLWSQRLPLNNVIPIFLLVNIVGVLLGYGLSRISRIRECGNNVIWKLMGFVLGTAFLIIGIWLFDSNVRPEGLYWVNRIDAKAIFVFGIIILFIILGEILWRHKEKLLARFS